MSVAILLVIARLSVRFRLKQRNLILSDLFLAISCCAAVGLLTADIIIWKQGTWLNIVNPGVTTLKVGAPLTMGLSWWLVHLTGPFI